MFIFMGLLVAVSKSFAIVVIMAKENLEQNVDATKGDGETLN